MEKLTLRRVEESDCEILFRWANDRETRNQSFHGEVISFEEHMAWFRKKLQEDTCQMFILLCYGKEAGQIRLDQKEDTAWLSYAIAPEYRGMGFGREILGLVEAYAGGAVLAGRVKRANIASQKCFEKNGYQRDETQNWVEYTKKIQK